MGKRKWVYKWEDNNMLMFGKYEINNDTIIRLSKIIDEIDTVCTDIYHEKDNLSYDELCAAQSLLFDLYYSTIQRLRSDDGRIELKSDNYGLWQNEKDVFDKLKKKFK